MTEEIIIAAGEPGQPFELGLCCITTRDNPWHAWIRAEHHILLDIGWPWHMRMRAALTCRFMAGRILRTKKPTQRSVKPIRWGWYPGIEKTRIN